MAPLDQDSAGQHRLRGRLGHARSGLSIEVDDVDAILTRMTEERFAIVHGPTDEPWGVRRFFVRDPFGTLVNIVEHR